MPNYTPDYFMERGIIRDTILLCGVTLEHLTKDFLDFATETIAFSLELYT